MAKNKKKSGNKNRREESREERKVVVTTSSPKTEKKKLTPTSSKGGNSKQAAPEMLFGKENFILIGVGALLVVIGLFLMTGGAQEMNEWNDAEVYSFRRTILAPLFILAGLITELFAIFKKKTVITTH